MLGLKGILRQWKSVKPSSCIIVCLCIAFVYTSVTLILSARTVQITTKKESFQQSYLHENSFHTNTINEINIDAQPQGIALEMEDFNYTAQTANTNTGQTAENRKQVQSGESNQK